MKTTYQNIKQLDSNIVNSCLPTAIALVAKKLNPMEDLHDLHFELVSRVVKERKNYNYNPRTAKNGKINSSTPHRLSIKLCEEHGMQENVELGNQYRRRQVNTFCKENPNFSGVIFVRGHALAVINGVIKDTWDSSKCKVQQIFEAKTTEQSSILGCWVNMI